MKVRHILILAIAIAVIAAVWMLARSRQPQTSGGTSSTSLTPLPADTTGPFYIGVSSLDVEENERAVRLFTELSKKLAQEPAVWANLGIARLRLGDLTGAASALETAAKLAPTNTQITELQAITDERGGQFPRAIERLRGLKEPSVAVLYRLADLLGKTGRDADPREQLAVYDRIRERLPENLAAAFGRARLLARVENKALLVEALQGFDTYRSNWSPEIIQQLDAAKAAADAGNFRTAATHLTFLQNLNLATPAYQTALAALGAAPGSVGEPMRQPLRYQQPPAVPASADDGLQFTISTNSAKAHLHLALALGAKPEATLVSLSADKLHISGQPEISVSGISATPARSVLCAADFNGDFLQDLALATRVGLKIWLQNQDGQLVAFTPAENVRAAFAAPSRGVWTLDYEADGDLDLLVSREGAAPIILRNGGDSTFTAVDALAAFPEIADACWSDFDGDGDGDLALMDSTGRILISWNHRAGLFSTPEAITELKAAALTYGDPLNIGEMDIVVLEQNGGIHILGFDREKKAWSARELARWSAPLNLSTARTSLNLADLDNNGVADLIASTVKATAIWLNQGQGKFQSLSNSPSIFVTSIADLNADGLLDLVGLAETNVATAQTRGTKNYHWQFIQTRTLSTVADGRLNSFGVGGRIEIRAGQLLAAAPIVSTRTHFGLGQQSQAEVARIVWPNGVAQVEFDLQANKEVTAVQRLKGSCPWVFTRKDGAFHFVKDFIWRSPLGMRINSQDTAGVGQTEDWILIPGKFLGAENGAYEIRVTAELWETHFFDHISLMVVDHPESTAAFIDERFVPTKQPKLEVLSASHAPPFAKVQNQAGRDASGAVASADNTYADDFPLGQFQGIAQDHWLEFELPSDAPTTQSLALIATGWIYPTDSSLNVAISQGDHPAPRGLMLEKFDAKLGWQPASGDLGFPAGKNKTVVIPLPTDASSDSPRRFRLRTNLEIYWDQLGWATLLPETETKVAKVKTLQADLRHRGFSKVATPSRRRPDLPDYNQLLGPGPIWRDLEGYYTRYGDVRELLQQVDDRYVIMNAGDEFVLRFAAPPAPPAGWTRDFVLVGDGWVKDGDFNTAHSTTVHPLPSHASSEYGGPPQTLNDDPVFQKNIADWELFHTRYVTPHAFERGLLRAAGTR